jgi:hypothetical protein
MWIRRKVQVLKSMYCVYIHTPVIHTNILINNSKYKYSNYILNTPFLLTHEKHNNRITRDNTLNTQVSCSCELCHSHRPLVATVSPWSLSLPLPQECQHFRSNTLRADALCAKSARRRSLKATFALAPKPVCPDRITITQQRRKSCLLASFRATFRFLVAYLII